MNWSPDLEPGQELSAKDVNAVFGCSWSSGMNRAHKSNSLVLFSNHRKFIYEDRWDGEVLLYTGTGLRGDQELDGNPNLTLYDAPSNGVGSFLFEFFEKGAYSRRGRA